MAHPPRRLTTSLARLALLLASFAILPAAARPADVGQLQRDVGTIPPCRDQHRRGDIIGVHRLAQAAAAARPRQPSAASGDRQQSTQAVVDAGAVDQRRTQ